MTNYQEERVSVLLGAVFKTLFALELTDEQILDVLNERRVRKMLQAMRRLNQPKAQGDDN